MRRPLTTEEVKALGASWADLVETEAWKWLEDRIRDISHDLAEEALLKADGATSQDYYRGRLTGLKEVLAEVEGIIEEGRAASEEAAEAEGEYPGPILGSGSSSVDFGGR